MRERCPLEPRIGLILGSGLGGLADRVANAVSVPYAEIPGFPCSQVSGHANELVAGQLAGKPVVAMRGRAHFYEGWTAAEVAFPVRVMQALGIGTLIVSNAAGGLNQEFRTGDLMLIRDHIFLPGLAGHSPLTGPEFVSMAGAYDGELRALAQRAAGGGLREGVYVMVAGPSYETPAEYAALHLLGADAVGMSTCPEVVVARALGVRVLGISLITNVLTGKPVSHEEVLSAADAAAERFRGLIEEVVRLA